MSLGIRTPPPFRVKVAQIRMRVAGSCGVKIKEWSVLSREGPVAGFNLKDESVLLFYDNIRKQVDAERRLTRKFMTGISVKQHAADLREELIRRRLQHTPIQWHQDETAEGGSSSS